MNVSWKRLRFAFTASVSIAILAGCPLPYEYNGKGATSNQSSDPSSPNVTSAVTVTCTEQGGTPVSVVDGGSFVSGKTTIVALSTATNNSVIYYTDDGSTLTNLSLAKKINASSGTMTITRTTALQTIDIHAFALGPNMLPSLTAHVTVSVSPYPVLTITRDKASVSEDGGTATFTVTSSSVPTSDITINLKTGGDYSTSDETGLTSGPNTAFTKTLTSGTTSFTIAVTGIHDPSTASHTVTLTIVADGNSPPAYTVGTPSSASVVLQDDASYGVTYNGNGATSGTVPIDSNYYLTGATVTALGNSGNLVRPGYTFAGWNTQADGSGATCTQGQTFTMGSASMTLYAKWSVIPAFYVNATTGSDSNAGTTSATAFKTITKALTVAASGATVNVAAGTYSTANGETFPLYIPAGVTLAGNASGHGSGVLIQGGGEPSGYTAGYISCSVVMGAQSVLEGLTVTNNSGIASFPMGVLLDQIHSSDGAVVTMNTITGNPTDGIYVRGGSSGGSIDNNIFTANTENDLCFVSSGGNGMSVSYNSFADMVELDTLGPDLGGGAAGSPGHNSFLGTSSTYFSCGGTVYAENNHWNHSPPTVGTVNSGFDVGISGSATVITTGYY